METAENKYITVAYKLYTTEDGEKDLVEEAKAEHPFQFISGLGTTLEAFESQIAPLNKGDKFEFTISSQDAYGEYNEEHVLDLPKHIFEIDGKFDNERIFAGNVVPLMDSEGRRMNGTVVEVKPDVVVVDMNHPLAGADLTFVGEVIESRPATNEEIQEIVNMMGGGCSCGCGDCGSDCGDHECGVIYQTFPHHQRAGGNRIGIFDSGNSVCIGFSKEFGFGTVVFKIHNLPELLDNTRIFHVIHARTCHAAVRVCVQKLHQLTHCIFINQHIIVQTIQIFVSFFQSFPQSGIKSTRTTEILCVDKHRYLTAVLFTDCFCRTV